MRDCMIDTGKLLLTNDIHEPFVVLYAGLVSRKIEGIHRVVVADVAALLATNDFRSCTQGRGQAHIGPTHLVMDGNHRAVSHALLGVPVPCTLLEHDDDVLQWEVLGDQGTMSQRPHEDHTLEALVRDGLKQASRETDFHTALTYARKCMKIFQIDISTWPAYLRDQIQAAQEK